MAFLKHTLVRELRAGDIIEGPNDSDLIVVSTEPDGPKHYTVEMRPVSDDASGKRQRMRDSGVVWRVIE